MTKLITLTMLLLVGGLGWAQVYPPPPTPGGGAVNSVTGSTGVAASPTTGSVVVSLDLAHANTWTTLQTFGAGLTVSSGNVTLTGKADGCATFASGVLGSTGVACGSGGGMVYPGAGIGVSTGTAWAASLTAPSGAIVGTTDTQTLTNKTVDGVTPTTFGYLDPTSSVQTQLNSKQATGNYITALTGDGTATGPGSVALTLATVNSSPGSCGDATHVCQVTTNGKGLVTAQSAVAITGGGGVTFSGTPTVSALITAASSTTIQTPSSTATLDTSGNLSVPGTISTGGSNAGGVDFVQGTAQTAGTNSVGFQAPTSVTSAFLFTLPGAPAAGVLHATNATPSVLSVSAVSLTADVSGILPVANGGNGTASPGVQAGSNISVTGSWPTQTIALANIANNTVLGNVSGSTGPASALTATQLTTLCNTFTASLSGCVPASGGGTTTFLRADGTFATPGGGGNVTGPGTSVSGDIALFNNTTGTLLSDSGKVVPTGTIVGTTDTQTLTNKTVDGVSPTTFGYVDPTSSVQTQLNAKAPLVSPSFTTPTLGVATATSINKVAITAPATSATLTIANGKTLTANNSITLAGTDSTTMTFPSTSQTIPGLGQANTYTSGLQDFSAVGFKPNAGASNPGTCAIGQVFFNTSATAGQNWYFCTATNTWTQQLNASSLAFSAITAGTNTAALLIGTGGSLAPTGTGTISANQYNGAKLARAIGYSFDGGGTALTSGKVGYLTVPWGCTISAWNIAVDTGTATIKVWKIASGTAIPTSSNSINTSGVAISTGTAIHSTTLTDFTTTTVTANDIVGIDLSAVSSATFVNFTLQCDQ